MTETQELQEPIPISESAETDEGPKIDITIKNMSVEGLDRLRVLAINLGIGHMNSVIIRWAVAELPNLVDELRRRELEAEQRDKPVTDRS